MSAPDCVPPALPDQIENLARMPFTNPTLDHRTSESSTYTRLSRDVSGGVDPVRDIPSSEHVQLRRIPMQGRVRLHRRTRLRRRIHRRDLRWN